MHRSLLVCSATHKIRPYFEIHSSVLVGANVLPISIWFLSVLFESLQLLVPKMGHHRLQEPFQAIKPPLHDGMLLVRVLSIICSSSDGGTVRLRGAPQPPTETHSAFPANSSCGHYGAL